MVLVDVKTSHAIVRAYDLTTVTVVVVVVQPGLEATMLTVLLPISQETSSPLSIAVPLAVIAIVTPLAAVTVTASLALVVVVVYALTVVAKVGVRVELPISISEGVTSVTAVPRISISSSGSGRRAARVPLP